MYNVHALKNIQVFAIFSILYTVQREEEGDTTSQAHYYRQSHYSIMQIMHSLLLLLLLLVACCDLLTKKNRIFSIYDTCTCMYRKIFKLLLSFQYCILFKGKRKETLPHRHIIIANLTKYPIVVVVVVVACCDLLTKKSYLFNVVYCILFKGKRKEILPHRHLIIANLTLLHYADYA